ncbi:hypothetical protein Ddye_014836 [Dipteronia dyeriana]|uniref:J domain-containing protein n=1 Tax=Dipteronia dyeriana TaxID=168575 RepID=A0AAD9U3U7_9ROSI|nr:hypothetical protein Ddye_014836 [Dipteronia dyeriana]
MAELFVNAELIDAAIYCLVCARSKNLNIAGIDCYMDAYSIHKLVASNINFAYGILDVKDSRMPVSMRSENVTSAGLALMFHPHKFHSVAAEGAMKMTNATWELLSDPRRREEYNKMMGYAPCIQQM